MKDDPIVAAIEGLDGADPGTAEGRVRLEKALASKSNLVAAKAAKIADEARARDLVPKLAAAFDRFLQRGDKGCAALNALARALVNLDCDDDEVFRRGMKHVQMEPVWGGSEDVAAELRGICAMGFANTRTLRKVRYLVDLLADREWPARVGAARAIAAVGSETASVALRLKILVGDRQPDVIGECLSGLIGIDGADALPLADSIANSRDEALRDAAILAIGASRRDDAIGLLKARYDRSVNKELRECILLALRSARTDLAMKYFEELSKEKNRETA
ncbi:MAG TPA: HEAT repeat domain-containing protein [Bryobacteraceae bacterium]|nr:HEAT repeat domain-containing protein [Bryobacteraceae bacterium]